MRKQIIWSLILASFFSVYIMPGRAYADSDNPAAQGALIGAAVGTVVAIIMAITAQNTRAKDPEAINKSKKTISASSAFDFGNPSEKASTSSEQNTINGYAMAIRF